MRSGLAAAVLAGLLMLPSGPAGAAEPEREAREKADALRGEWARAVERVKGG